MELEFCKHFKDATNLLLMMDHDSGYVEGVETYTSNESNPCVAIEACKEPDNFLLSEDALLEKPDVFLNFMDSSPVRKDKDFEQTKKTFFTPEIINSSVKSEDSTVIYSGLKNESSTDVSTEIPVELPILFRINMEHKAEQSCIVSHKLNEESEDNDVLVLTCSESEMSLEETFEPVIIENKNISQITNCNIITPLKIIVKDKPNLKESAIIDTVFTDSIVESDLKPTDLPDFTDNKGEYKKAINNRENISPSTPTVNIPEGPSFSKPYSTSKWSITSVSKSDTPTSSILTTVTNTYEESKAKRRLTLVFSKSEKENIYSVKRRYPSITPEKEPINPVDPKISPDIFDEEIVDSKQNYFEIQTQERLLAPLTQTHTDEKHVDQLDQKLLKRTQKGMSGVLPPPSVTLMNLSVHDILTKWEQNKNYCIWNQSDTEKQDSSLNSSTDSNKFSRSLLISVDLQEAKESKWPDVLNLRCHGLHYNCGKVSEEIVDLCDKFQKRFVGSETQSTCTVFETQTLTSPSKRKILKPRWGGKSPGRRLSHLARRRITFSSSNLQASGSSLAGSRARQILVDAKKIDLLNRRNSPRKSPRKTPRKTPKKTPRKSPKIKTRTPSSSAKKKLAMRFRKLTGEFQTTLPSTSEISSVHRTLFKSPERGTKSENSSKNTKRALFQSPNHTTISHKSHNSSASASEEKNQLRRALFVSPRKMSPFKGHNNSPFRHALKFGFEKKRKRSESEDDPPTKFPRSMSLDIRSSSLSNASKTLPRAQSELNISLNKSQSQNELSEQHKKKLLWAVSGALQSQNVTSTHPQWKVFASVLARVTRRFYTSQRAASGVAGGRLEGSTTERMNRIARYHVISVIKGKSADEIISEYVKNRTKVQRPQGYVAPEDFNNTRTKLTSGGKENVFQDRANTLPSWEKNKREQVTKPAAPDNKIERIRKVINFGEDR